MVDAQPRRHQLQELLELTSGLSEDHVHFQPPNGMQMVFPAITYSRIRPKTDFADNLPYLSAQGYTVTVIAEDPDSDILGKIAALPYCTHDRWYATDGLNHDAFTLYF